MNALRRLFGINEIIFLAGFGLLFFGLRGLWNIYAAMTVCGALMLAVSIGGVIMKQKKVA